MKVIHSLGQKKIKKEVQEDVGFLLTNDQGAYFSLFSQPSSRYQGWFVPFDDKLYRIIENIEPVKAPAVDELRNNFWNIDRKRDYLYESFVLPDHYNSLIYELSEPAEIELFLDIKESYNNSENGRFYEISEEKDVVIVSYQQEGQGDFYYLAIKSDILDIKKLDKWIARKYQLDKKRNSPPYERYVYQALKLSGQKFIFSVAKDKKQALKEARLIFRKTVILKQLQMEKTKKLPGLKKIKDKEIKMAYLCAQHSLDGLTVFHDRKLGIYAGLPWFWQFWVRDEAISLKALADFLPNKAKDILNRLIISIRKDGRILAMPVENADGVGWVFKRVSDLISEKKFKKEKIEEIKRFLIKSINGLLKHHTQDNLAVSNSSETWMDTQDRSGARIEIQALRLNIYQLAFKLTKDKKYLQLERQLKQTVQQKFWNGQILADGQDDFTLRPNIFLAAYIYPKLLKKKQWRQCFENALVKLWLDWGGLATIDKDNRLFCQTHTGQDSKSYHNGDAWFYLNNLAGLVLYKFGKKKFAYQINRILEASTNEILWQGVIGHHSELSSAQALKSEGCWTQAWSNAFYMEMVKKLLKL